MKIKNINTEREKMKEASQVIKEGGLVAFPTETVYGLGANALDENAVSKIFKAKGRPSDNPLIVHICDVNQLDDLVEEIPERAKILMEKFWPGSLTLLFKKSQLVPLKTSGGLDTVAIRMPDNKIALELIKQSNLPIAAPSANTSGKPSPTNPSHVMEDLEGKIDVLVDGGNTGVGLESTVLDISTEIPVILRPGGITLEDLLLIFPKVEYDPALENNNQDITPRSPGQKYRHYSPKAMMKIFSGNSENVYNEIQKLSNEYVKEGYKVGIMITSESKDRYSCENTIVMGDKKNPQTIATNLFHILRQFDKLNVDIIIAEGVEESGIGKAIMNRMKKAAGGDITYV
ncbi:L-threonylcarbamoyladenylate synthase [Gottschalkia acidurici]|nr:L-threonylcarbamoyladenylate synthase [Gottschalkia acidurici]